MTACKCGSPTVRTGALNILGVVFSDVYRTEEVVKRISFTSVGNECQEQVAARENPLLPI